MSPPAGVQIVAFLPYSSFKYLNLKAQPLYALIKNLSCFRSGLLLVSKVKVLSFLSHEFDDLDN
jgi:hypothetical protein